jgi:hypothetical protein
MSRFSFDGHANITLLPGYRVALVWAQEDDRQTGYRVALVQSTHRSGYRVALVRKRRKAQHQAIHGRHIFVNLVFSACIGQVQFG